MKIDNFQLLILHMNDIFIFCIHLLEIVENNREPVFHDCGPCKWCFGCITCDFPVANCKFCSRCHGDEAKCEKCCENGNNICLG